MTDNWGEQKYGTPILKWKAQVLDNTYFLRAFTPSPFHWHFQQAYEALQQNLFLPGLSGLLNAIEASLRATICELENTTLDGDLGRVMSNSLLRNAKKHGMKIEVLAFPDETNFQEMVASKEPVQLVRLRNDICHGNFHAYSNNLAEVGEFFTPECLRPISANLLDISFKWAKELSIFRQETGLLPKSEDELTYPKNPLSNSLTTPDHE